MADTKAELLKAAGEIFSQQGYAKTKVADITKQAGVGHGAFYHYFDSKKDIFLELIRSFLMILNKEISSLSIEDVIFFEKLNYNASINLP